MVSGAITFAGCLRNAGAVAVAAEAASRRIAVVAAGEHWPGGSLRPAIEDLLGAGAIIDRLSGRLSPDARVAKAAYREFKTELAESLRGSLSGQELIARGLGDDVELAGQVDCSTAVPRLSQGGYRDLATA